MKRKCRPKVIQIKNMKGMVLDKEDINHAFLSLFENLYEVGGMSKSDILLEYADMVVMPHMNELLLKDIEEDEV